MTADELAQRLERIEQLLLTLMSPPVNRDFYSTSEAANRLGLSPWYVRRLCATGEILAEKHPESGPGPTHTIAREFLVLLQDSRGSIQQLDVA